MFEKPNPRLPARLALLAFAAGCAAWLLTLDYAQKISTNVIDLIPAAEQSPDQRLAQAKPALMTTTSTAATELSR